MRRGLAQPETLSGVLIGLAVPPRVHGRPESQHAPRNAACGTGSGAAWRQPGVAFAGEPMPTLSARIGALAALLASAFLGTQFIMVAARPEEIAR